MTTPDTNIPPDEFGPKDSEVNTELDKELKKANEGHGSKLGVDIPDKIDFTEPFFVAVYQTEARTFTKQFFGLGAERKAQKFATDRAMNYNTTVAILGPQISVLAPPKPSEPESVSLPWVEKSTET